MPVIICPLCQAVLTPDEKTWCCAQGHSFDVAREGYVNLLLVQQKKSREPGDGADMVQGRRDFLSAGYYQPLREAVVQTLKTLKPSSLVDIGCGEGYYTHAMADIVADVVGLDIAKPAIKAAAKRDKKTSWFVANSAQLPLEDQSVDVATSLFSPLPIEEMARVLKPAGHLLLVTPGSVHLHSIRKALFETLTPHHPEKFLEKLAPRFSCISRQDIHFPLALPQAAVRQLLLMTPYVWRAKADKRASIEAEKSIQTEANFTLFLMRQSP